MKAFQGEVWWADFPGPEGSEPGFRRPVVVVQCDRLNNSGIGTVVCVALTTQLKWANALGNVVVPARESGLPKDSIANVSQISALDRAELTDFVAKLPRRRLQAILAGTALILAE